MNTRTNQRSQAKEYRPQKMGESSQEGLRPLNDLIKSNTEAGECTECLFKVLPELSLDISRKITLIRSCPEDNWIPTINFASLFFFPSSAPQMPK